MKNSTRSNRLWLITFSVVVVALGAFTVLAQPTQSDMAAAEQAAAGGSSSLNGVPIGVILPYVGSLEDLPSGWAPCDGRVVYDPGSPFNGKALPNLMDNRFPMGVASAEELNSTGGSNEITMDGEHRHVGTAAVAAQRNFTSGQPRAPESRGNNSLRHTHDLDMRVNGAHDHGGDNRPQYYGTYFIIKVK